MSTSPKWMRGNPDPIKKADVISVDQSSPAAQQVSGYSIQTGVSITGELTGDTIQPYGPSGIYSIPVLSTIGKNGTEIIYIPRSDEGFVLGVRDTNNQNKAGVVNPGEISVYAPGATGINRVYLDINGNAFISVQNNIQLNAQQQIKITSQQTMTLQGSTININGSSHPAAFADAIYSQLQAISATLKSLVGQASFGVPYVPPTSASQIGSTTVNLG